MQDRKPFLADPKTWIPLTGLQVTIIRANQPTERQASPPDDSRGVADKLPTKTQQEAQTDPTR